MRRSIASTVNAATPEEKQGSNPLLSHKLLQLSGVGQAKLERYGDEFMAVIRNDE